MLGETTVEEIPMTCRQCGTVAMKPIVWLQQNTFLTCEVCGVAALIDKDGCAGMLARQELRQQS